MKYCHRLILAVVVLAIATFILSHRTPDQTGSKGVASMSIENRPRPANLWPAPSGPAPGGVQNDRATAATVNSGGALPAPVGSPAGSWQISAPAPALNRFAEWSNRFLSAKDKDAQAALLSEGLTLAEARRQVLFRLIQDDPRQALDAAVPFAVRAALPDSIQVLLEQPVSGRGDLEVFCVNPMPDSPHDHDAFERRALIDQVEYAAYVYGRRLGQVTTQDTSLHGIALSDGAQRVLAVHESPIRVLEEAESMAYLAAHPEVSLAGKSCAYGSHPLAEGDEIILLDAGGLVQVACTHEHVAALSEEMVAAYAPGEVPVFNNPRNTGRKRVIMYRIAFADIANPALSQSAAESLIVEMNDYWTRVSYGLMTIAPHGEGSDIVQVALAGNGADYNDNDSRVRSEAEAAAIAQGYDLSQYEWRVFFTGSLPSFSWCGLGSVGGGNPWSMVRCLNVGVTMHELGHNLGFWHGNFWDTDDKSAMGPGENNEYGDPFDVMGSSGNEGDYCVKYKHQIGWIADDDYPWISSSGQWRIFAQDNPDSYGLRGLRYRPTTALDWSHDDVSLEFRQAFASNPWLTRGLGVRWGYSTGSDRSQLVDTTPGSDNGRTDSAIVIGRTFADVDSDVYITPVRYGNTYPPSIDVVVNFGPFPGNQAPDVLVRADSSTAAPGAPVTLTAVASDPDGDELAYQWEFGDGSIGENSAVTAHSWSAAGEYAAQCTVSDMKGGVSTHSVLVRVGLPATYTISGRVYREGAPVEGVLVRAASDRYAYTDSDGSYVIGALSAGSYSVTAQKYPYVFANPWSSNPVAVGPANANHIDFVAVDIQLNDVTLVMQNAVWKYLDNGSDQGTAWKEPEFDDAGWEAGPAELGYGDDGLGTVVDFGPDENNKYITTYFRHTFTSPDPATLTDLFLDVHRDDGVVVYLNGTEILRDNMPGGSISYNTTAVGTADGNVTTDVPHAALRAGQNVLAAEIHQANGTSSDIGFYARLLATSSATFEDLELLYIASPADKTILVQPTVIPITVNAYKNNGAYTNVEFFVDGVSLGSIAAEPFTILWMNPELGTHTVSVLALDQDGLESAPPSVTVEIVDALNPTANNLTLIDLGSVWKYLDDGTDQGVDWKSSDFDDSTWPSGPAQLGYGDGDEQTVVEDNPVPGYQSSADDRYITTYFRRAFEVVDVSRVAELSLQVLRDDGVVVYLNGTEVFRNNMPNGAPAFNTLASSGISGAAENAFLGTLVSPGLLVTGTNVVAAEIHQNSSTSSDISFELSLAAVLTPAPLPGVVVISPAADALLPVSPTIEVQAQATATPGQTVTGVAFYEGSDLLGLDTEFPFATVWSNPVPGHYELTAVSTESGGIMRTSAPVLVTVAYPGLPQAVISAGSVWKYLDTGRAPSSDWATLAYNDGAWKAGPARLGYGGDGETTTVDFGRDGNHKHITTWFRRVVDIADPMSLEALRFRVQRDDGLLVFLNGVEVIRDNMLTGDIDPRSLAASGVGNEEETAWLEYRVDAELLQAGSNVVAVEIHQSGPDSSDLGFDLELSGLVSTNLSEGIYLVEPAQGAVHTAGAPWQLEAYTTGLADIEKVEFFAGAEKLGEATTAPYRFAWAGPMEGDHELSAVATYDGGLMASSPVISVHVIPASASIGPVNLIFVPTGSSWRYLDNGVDQGTAWRERSFNDTAWSLGSARLGYGLDGEVTTVNSGRVTTYYRRNFTVLDPGVLETVTFLLQRDDGAVVYLNGHEVFRSNMPGSTIAYNTLALGTVDGLEEQYYHEVILPVAGSGIMSGPNLLAVELHQSSANSSDAGFDLFVTGQGTTSRRVFLSQPAIGSTYAKSEALTLEAFGWAGTGRTISKIEFFANNIKVGETTGRPHRVTWSSDEAGIFALAVVATDSAGDTIVSAPVPVAIGFEPVTLRLVAPGANWRYHDLGQDLGTTWAQPEYDDAGWGFGPARLGYGGDGESTQVDYGPNANDKYPTTYFRTTFDVPEGSSLTSLTFLLQRDDGAVVWLDGEEAYRDNMPGGPVTFETLASAAVSSGDEQAWFPRQLEVPPLAPGRHVLAVEVHQSSQNSSDLGFDLELQASGLQIQLPPPEMAVEHLPNGQIRLSWPAPSLGWNLQTTLGLRPPVLWLNAPNPVVEINGRKTVTISAVGTRFYRLIKN